MRSPAWLTQRHRTRFQVLGHLGSGGMGDILRARDRELDREVALKLVRCPSPVQQQRAVREAESLARVRHPNLIQLYDLVHLGERRGLVLVLEYLEGRPLAAGCGREHALETMLEVAEALQALHEADLVHRDVKPSNVMVTADGRVVLLDLGLAYTPTDARLTRTDAVVGTPNFLAPELVLGEDPTPAADWYGWGMTLYRLLEGAPPFSFETFTQAVLHGRLPPLRFEATPAGAPEVALIRACLAYRPEERPHGRAALEALLPPPAAPTKRRRAGPRSRRRSSRRPGPPPISRLRLGGRGALAALAGGAGVAWLLLSAGPRPRAEEPPPPAPTEAPEPARPRPSRVVAVPPGWAPSPEDDDLGLSAWGQVPAGAWVARWPSLVRAGSRVEAQARAVALRGRLPTPFELERARGLGLLRGPVHERAWSSESAPTRGPALVRVAWDRPPEEEWLPGAPAAEAMPRWSTPPPDPAVLESALARRRWRAALAELPAIAAYRSWVAGGGDPASLPEEQRRARRDFDEALALRGLPSAHGPSLYLRPRDRREAAPAFQGWKDPQAVSGWCAAAARALEDLDRELAARRAELRELRERGTPPSGAEGLVPFVRLAASLSATDLKFAWRAARTPNLAEWYGRWIRDAGEHAEAALYAVARAPRAGEDLAPRMVLAILARLGTLEAAMVFSGHLGGGRLSDLLGDDRLPSSPWGWYLRGALGGLDALLAGEAPADDPSRIPRALAALQRSLLTDPAGDPRRALRQGEALEAMAGLVGALPPATRAVAERRLLACLRLVEPGEQGALERRVRRRLTEEARLRSGG